MPRLFLIWTIFALFASRDMGALAAERPNVLMICVDDLKPAAGCFGDAAAVTPHIDALAARGVLFNYAYCNQAVCSPSRNALWTSLRPQSIGIYDLSTHFRTAVPAAVTLSQYFMQQAYQAQGLGKILHTGHGNYDDPHSWSVPSWRPKAASYVSQASLDNTRIDASGKKRGPATEAAVTPDESYADGQVAMEAIARLEAASRIPEQPFFLAVGFIRPHLPFVAPQAYWDLYDPAQLPQPEILTPPVGAPSYAPTTSGELHTYTNVPKPVDAAATRHLIHGYYAATSYTDAQIGKLIATLDRLGLSERTIVVLWGDHGWHLGDHGMWCKHSNYEQATRIPLIVAAPGGAKGASSQALVETVDIYPTLAELAGLPAPLNLDGRSFAHVVRTPTAAGRDYVQHVYPRGERLGRAIRNHRYRLVEWKLPGATAEEAEIELYDYQQDPLETRNLAPTQPEVVDSLRKTLAQQPEALPQRTAGP